jgi:hypothetical protein
VQTVKFRCQAKIGAVIHDEPYRSANSLFQFARVFQNLAGSGVFIPVLQQGGAASDQFLCREEHRVAARKLSRIQNGIQPKKFYGVFQESEWLRVAESVALASGRNSTDTLNS